MDRKNRWKETLVGMVRLTDRKDRWNGTLAEKNIPWNGTEKSMDKKINGIERLPSLPGPSATAGIQKKEPRAQRRCWKTKETDPPGENLAGKSARALLPEPLGRRPGAPLRIPVNPSLPSHPKPGARATPSTPFPNPSRSLLFPAHFPAKLPIWDLTNIPLPSSSQLPTTYGEYQEICTQKFYKEETNYYGETNEEIQKGAE